MSRHRLAALIAALAIGATIVAEPRAAQASPLIRMTWPTPGMVVNVGTMLTAEVDPSVPRQAIDGVDFEVSADGRTFRTFGGPSPDGMSDYQALWDAGNVPSGTYQIRATVRVRFDPLPPVTVPIELLQLNLVSTDPIPVRVNTQPVAWAQSQLLQPMRNSALILFQGHGMDQDGQVVRYEWDFEDGSPLDPNPTTTHVFPVPGSFTLSLTVYDNLGGKDTGHFILTTTQIPTFPFVSISMIRKIRCKCKKMDIKTAGAVDGPAGFSFAPQANSGIPPADQGGLGPYNAGAVGGPPPVLGGAGPWTVKCRFEVIAELEPGSDPALCPEGQRVQRTGGYGASQGGKKQGRLSSDPRYNSGGQDVNDIDDEYPDDPYDPNDDDEEVEEGECGVGSPRWCDDDYHGGGDPEGRGRSGKNPPNGYKKYEKQTRILWLDAPGINNITKADLAKGGASYHAKFEARVAECKCTWEVHIVVNAAGQIVQNEVTNEVCT